MNKKRNDTEYERKLTKFAKRLTSLEAHDSYHLPTRRKLYDALCDWKVSTSNGDVDQGSQLYIAMESAGLTKEFKAMIGMK